MKKVLSIKGKIAILLTTSLVAMLIVILIAARLVISNSVEQICENYLYDSCVSASNTLYESFFGDSERKDMKVRLQFILNGVGIEDVKSSEAILVDKDGTILYNNDSKLIGTTVENNEVINAVIKKVQSGTIETADVKSCMVDGTEKYIAYMCTVNDWVLYVQADKDEVLQPIETMNFYCSLVGVVVLVIGAITGFIVTGVIAKPIRKMTGIINDISKLDLRDKETIPKTRDEIGRMGEAIVHMRENLSSIVTDIKEVSEVLVDDANILYSISESVSTASADNSATTEQLAAGMQETSASTDIISNNIADVRNNINNVVDKINDGTKLADEVMNRVDGINESTNKSNCAMMNMYDEIKHISIEAMEKAKAVEKIHELSAGIQEISSQTNLLALNASIEAARAGEAGKGFAVVAGEVGKLADETLDTAGKINIIVDNVNESVHTLMECLQRCLDFLGQDVTKDYEAFSNASEEFNEETKNIVDFMSEANREVNMLKETVEIIAESMESINVTMGEASQGVVDIASKTGEVENLSKEIYDKTLNAKAAADKLNDIADKFKK